MTTSCKIIRLSDYRRPPPPVNPALLVAAWYWAWMGEACHAVSAMLRGEKR